VLILAAILAAQADQAAKWWVREGLAVGDRAPFLGDVVVFTHVTSPGQALLAADALALPLLIGVHIVALVLLLALAARTDRSDRLSGLALGLIVGGGAGNAIDRFYFGEIVDWVRLSVGGVALPVFNLADVAIAAGVALLLLDLAASEAAERAAHAGAAPAHGTPPDAASDAPPRAPLP
jgi:signal peptidase II